jgi:WASH complex subunit strumpellin
MKSTMMSSSKSTNTSNNNNSTSSSSSPPPPLFLAPENLCGQTLLQLVGEGHSILATIKILSERVPAAFLVAANNSSSSGNDDTVDDGGKKSGGGGFLNLFGKDDQHRRTSSSTTAAAADDTDNNIHHQGNNNNNNGDMEDAIKYTPFLFDFSYLHNPEEFEAKLTAEKVSSSSSSNNNNIPIADLEREFAINHITQIQEYYHLFTSIYNYQYELNTFASNLHKGYYIQYTVESVLLDINGRALLCEAVWLYGVILIMLERLLPGPIRERLVIAYFRFNVEEYNGDVSCIEHVCKLCRGTGIFPPVSTTSATFHKYISHKYPMDEEKLFGRYPLHVDLVRNVIGCLISDDIYLQSSAFPNVDQRSIRLSKQASMLYVVLFFDPVVLRDEQSRLREIVDKYFYDNWVVHVYAGMTADLSIEWNRFDAAKSALNNVLQVDNVKKLHVQNAKLIGQCMAELRAYLTMGILTDVFVLDNRHDLLNCLRKCNIAVRWRILHRRTTNSLYHGIVCATSEDVTADPRLQGNFAVNDTHVVSLLLLSSQLEMQLKTIFTQLLAKKESIWMSCRAKASSMMDDLAHYFEGDVTLARISRHDGLIEWFTSMASEIRDLAYNSGDHFTVTGRKIQLCVQALEEVEQYDLVDRDVQVKTFLHESRDLLLQMARAVGINESISEDIKFISDISYGVESMKSYVKIIHTRISKDPSNVNLLQGFFLKLSNSLDGPVVRLKELKSPEVERVSGYYSSQLVAFVRNVLEIVPVSVFGILVQISDIFERRLQRLPTKIQGDKLGAYAQLGERYKLSMMAHEISIFADGVLSMDNSIIGGIEINPRKLLDEGLRKEMVQHVSELMNNLLQFDFSADSETVASMSKHQGAAMRSLASLSRRLEGFKSALECIEDYVSIHGLKMWHEEFSRIINYNVEQEVNKYLLKKVLDADSAFQSEIVPIPRFSRTQNEPTCINFMGRIVSMLIKITDTQYTTFSIEKSGWFMNDGTEVCGLKTLSLLRQAVGISGLTGIDRLLCYRILHELHRFVKFFRTNVTKQGVLLEQLRDELYPEWKTPTKAVSIYASGTKKAEMLMLPMLTCFRRIGQAQMLRRMIRFQLERCSRADAKMLAQSVSTLNASVLSSDDPFEGSSGSDPLMKKYCDMSLAVGIGDPLQTVFMATDPLEGLPVLLLLFVITYVPKLSYNAMFGALSKTKSGYPIDGWPLIAGISTLLKQFHPSYAKSFLAYLGQFVRVSITAYFERKQGKKEVVLRLKEDLRSTLVLVNQFCDISSIPKSELHEHIPQYMMEMCSDV